MGLFKKKPDPISERARDLNQEIAALEAQIKKLSSQEPQAPAPSPLNHHPQPAPAASQPAPAPQPRLRSTAMPHHRHPPSNQTAAASAAREPVFEKLHQKATESLARQPVPEHHNDLGVRKSDLNSSWKRLKNHFRGPSTSNPKLVNYLAAGSVQGLRPLRYERRVARNRFIFLVTVLVLVLWGLIAFLKHR